MRVSPPALLLATLLGVPAGVPSAARVPPAGAPAASEQPALAPTTLVMRGTIGAYDASAKILTLSTDRGKIRFPIAPGTHVRYRWQKIEPARLQALTGHRAVVRYLGSNRDRHVRSVHVFDNDPRFD